MFCNGVQEEELQSRDVRDMCHAAWQQVEETIQSAGLQAPSRYDRLLAALRLLADQACPPFHRHADTLMPRGCIGSRMPGLHASSALSCLGMIN